MPPSWSQPRPSTALARRPAIPRGIRNYNYGAAGSYLGFDGIKDPGIVATDAITSFKTVVWFWIINSSCHSDIVHNEDFGATIRYINPIGCGTITSSIAQRRVNLYKSYCATLNVDPGSSLT